MLIDSHSHFDDDSFSSDREAVLTRATAAGVTAQVVPAIAACYWSRLQTICQNYPGLYPAYGLHPIYLAEHRPAHLIELGTWLSEAVAVGECGLDYYIEELDKQQQIQLFMSQLYLARDAQLPVIVHARRSVEDVLHCLRKVPGIQGVIHSFAGSLQQAHQVLKLGFYLGFGGPITYPRAHKLRELVKQLPLDRLLLETDAPDQPLSNHRGERNEPAYLVEILEIFAELRGQDPLEIAAIATRNTRDLFKL